MAGFRTHITMSTLAGVGYGAGAYLLFDMPGPTCLLAGGLCSVSGMLPDIDSDSGKPLRESMAFAAAILPMMLAERLRVFPISTELIVLFGAILYLLIRFGGAALLKKFTVHRGMFHSIPAAVIAAEVAFLLASGETEARIYKAGGVFIGYMVHLVLDEFYSVKVSARGVRIKKSLGTAVKVFGHQWLPNITTYATFALLTMLAVKEPSWMLDYQQKQRDLREQKITQEVLERNDLVAVPKDSWTSGDVHKFETGNFEKGNFGGAVGEKAKETHETIGSFLKKWR